VFFATVQTFLLARKLPRVLLRIFLRLALEATEFTDLGIILLFYGGSDPFKDTFRTAFQIKL
jgi:hypothetical protein